MFLLRCLFWLGLVFSQIAQVEGTNATAFADQAARAAGGPAASLGQAAVGAVEQHCRAEPAKCLALAASTVKIAKADPSAAVSDTLTAADRAPAWRGGRTSGAK